MELHWVVIVGAGSFLLGFIVGRSKSDTEPRVVTPPRPLPNADAEAQVRAFLAKDDVIGAIKTYRQLTGCGLKDAKDAVDAMRGKR